MHRSLSDKLVLELARSDDAERIALMSRDLIELGLPWRWRAGRIQQMIDNVDTIVLVARIEQRLIGFAIMNFKMEDAHLMLFAISPSYRRNGIGRALLTWLERSARVAGIVRLHLEVRADNRIGRTFYQEVGFSEVRFVPRLYGGRYAGVRMLRRLR